MSFIRPPTRNVPERVCTKQLSFRNKVVVKKNIIKIKRSGDSSLAFNYNFMYPVEVTTKKPNSLNESFPDFINFCLFGNVKYQIKQDKIRALYQKFDEEDSNNIPVRSAFDSLLNPVSERYQYAKTYERKYWHSQ